MQCALIRWLPEGNQWNSNDYQRNDCSRSSITIPPIPTIAGFQSVWIQTALSITTSNIAKKPSDEKNKTILEAFRAARKKSNLRVTTVSALFDEKIEKLQILQFERLSQWSHRILCPLLKFLVTKSPAVSILVPTQLAFLEKNSNLIANKGNVLGHTYLGIAEISNSFMDIILFPSRSAGIPLSEQSDCTMSSSQNQVVYDDL